jgi:hypothetical protein
MQSWLVVLLLNVVWGTTVYYCSGFVVRGVLIAIWLAGQVWIFLSICRDVNPPSKNNNKKAWKDWFGKTTSITHWNLLELDGKVSHFARTGTFLDHTGMMRGDVLLKYFKRYVGFVGIIQGNHRQRRRPPPAPFQIEENTLEEKLRVVYAIRLISQLVVDDNDTNDNNNNNSSSIVIYEEKEEDDDDDDALSILAEWDSLLNSIVLHPGPFCSTPNRDNVIVTDDPNTFHRIKNDCGIAFFFFSRRRRRRPQELTLAVAGMPRLF